MIRLKMRGTCEELCPLKEANWRIKEKLLHFFEFKNGEKHVPGVLVKSFARSAAGTKTSHPKDLRTEDCLQRTVEYLLKNILIDKRRPFHIVYDFIFDRLRAVRQETIIQNFNGQQVVRTLKPIIVFLAYSRYRLCEEPIDNFDPNICDQHLQECLKRILVAYDELEASNHHCTEDQTNKRIFFESLYQIYNLGSIDALTRSLQLPDKIRSNGLFGSVFSISISFLQGNTFRVMSGIRILPHVLSAIGALRFQSLRRKSYEIFSHAYNSRQFSVPIEFVARIVQQHRKDLIEDCEYYNLKLSEDCKSIHFMKSDFNGTVNVLPAKHEYFVDEKFEKSVLSDILLAQNI